MPQTFVSPDDLVHDSFLVRGTEAHHLIRVLRKKPNDEIHLFNGKGAQFIGRLTALDPSKNEVRGVIVEKKKAPPKSHTLVLFQGIPRGSKFDFVIEKATELGVDAIVPFLSEKNPIELSPANVATKMARWSKVAQAAAKQCNRSDVPSVEAPRDLKDLAPHLKEGLTLFLWESEEDLALKKVLHVAGASHFLINIVIGPEAGFTSQEAAFLESCGAFSVTLGKRILRTETAGLAALSILNYELGLY